MIIGTNLMYSTWVGVGRFAIQTAPSILKVGRGRGRDLVVKSISIYLHVLHRLPKLTLSLFLYIVII